MDASSSDNVRKSSNGDLSGRRLGDYQILRQIGRGAMAQVYLAEQTSLKRQIALKVLKSELVDDDVYVARFQREARSAALLSHANIVQIHDVGCVGGVYYIAQEYVAGMNLAQWLHRNGAVDLQTGMVIMWQVASALSKAAESGIVHRDIKPENILLAKTGEVKVADFGLARAAQSNDGVNLTQVGMTLGTPLYMSPEQVEGQSLDPRSDIYSFGVTCYHMLAGEPPFRGETALSVAVQHIKNDPKPIESIRTDLPPALGRVVHKMLAKDPAKRYASARELQRELREIQRKHLADDWPDHLPDWTLAEIDPTHVRATQATEQLTTLMQAESEARRSKRRRLAAVGAFALIGLLLGVLAAAGLAGQDASLVEELRETQPKIPEFDSKEEHWFDAAHRAALTGEPDPWEQLIAAYPDDAYWVDRAKRQLAYNYWLSNDLTHANELFREFADFDKTMEPRFRAFGLAGLCYIAAKRGEIDRAEGYRDELLELRDEVPELQAGRPPGPYGDEQLLVLIFTQALDILRSEGGIGLDGDPSNETEP